MLDSTTERLIGPVFERLGDFSFSESGAAAEVCQ